MFDDPYDADEAKAALHRMGLERLLTIDETAVFVRHADGKVRVTQDVNVVEKDKHVGHVLGLMAAAVTGTMPFIMAGWPAPSPAVEPASFAGRTRSPWDGSATRSCTRSIPSRRSPRSRVRRYHTTVPSMVWIRPPSFSAKCNPVARASLSSSPIARMTLYVDDNEQASDDFRTQSGHYALAGEGLAVGRDSGDPVSKEYQPGFKFTGGRLIKVVYDIADDMYLNVERQLAAALARD